MALDPSIILANADPARQFDQVASMQKAANLQSAMMQQQMQRQQMQDAQDFKAKYGVTPGMAKSVKDMETAGYQAEHAKAQAVTEKTKAQDWLADQQRRVFEWGQKALEENPEAAPQIHAQTLKMLAANAQKLGIDTTKSDDPLEFTTSSAPFAPGQDGAPKVWDINTHRTWLRDKAESVTPEAVAQKRAELQQKADAENWKILETSTGFAMFNSKTGEMKPVEGGFKPAPKGTSINLGLGGSGLTNDALNMQVEAYRKTGVLPGLGQGKAGTELRMKIMNAAAAADKAEGKVTDLAEAKKSFKTQQDAQKFFTTGKGADAMRQQETILHHAQVFQQIADALDNGNIQLANKLGNTFGLQMGSDKATNLKMAGQIFSAEVGKYLAGSMGSAEERAELAKLMPMFNSPEQFKGGLKTLSNLVEGQRKSWMRQRTAALSGKVTDETETPASGKVGTKKMLDSWMRDNPNKTRTEGKELMKANGYSIEGL